MLENCLDRVTHIKQVEKWKKTNSASGLVVSEKFVVTEKPGLKEGIARLEWVVRSEWVISTGTARVRATQAAGGQPQSAMTQRCRRLAGQLQQREAELARQQQEVARLQQEKTQLEEETARHRKRLAEFATATSSK